MTFTSSVLPPHERGLEFGERHSDRIASTVASIAAAPYLARGELVHVLADWPHPPIPIHVVYPPNRHLSARVRAFVEWAAELFARQALEAPMKARVPLAA